MCVGVYLYISCVCVCVCVWGGGGGGGGGIFIWLTGQSGVYFPLFLIELNITRPPFLLYFNNCDTNSPPRCNQLSGVGYSHSRDILVIDIIASAIIAQVMIMVK